MASNVKAIENMFTDLRRELLAMHEKRKSELNDADKPEAEQLWLFMQMGLFAAESVIVDIKRIADALNEIVLNTQPRG
jgi:hypothetical protein